MIRNNRTSKKKSNGMIFLPKTFCKIAKITILGNNITTTNG